MKNEKWTNLFFSFSFFSLSFVSLSLPVLCSSFINGLWVSELIEHFWFLTFWLLTFWLFDLWSRDLPASLPPSLPASLLLIPSNPKFKIQNSNFAISQFPNPIHPTHISQLSQSAHSKIICTECVSECTEWVSALSERVHWVSEWVSALSEWVHWVSERLRSVGRNRSPTHSLTHSDCLRVWVSEWVRVSVQRQLTLSECVGVCVSGGGGMFAMSMKATL